MNFNQFGGTYPFNSNFIKFINTEIDTLFLILDTKEKNMIKSYINVILVLIYYRFHFDNEEQFYLQLLKNNNQDIIMIIFLLFPYMKDDNNFENYKKLRKLSDISIAKKNNQYVSNIQYDRMLSEKKEEYNWNEIDLYNNFYAIIQTIYRCSNHLYVNWINIFPITLNNYKKSSVYTSTINYLNNNLYEDILFKVLHTPNLLDDIYNYQGIDIREYYHAILNDLYIDILPYKWLLYEIYDYNNKTDRIYIQEICNYFGYIFHIDDKDDNIINFRNKWSYLLLVNDPFIQSIIYQILIHFDFNLKTYFSDDSKYKPLISQRSQDTVYSFDDIDYDISNESIINKEDYAKILERCKHSEFIEQIYSFLIDTITSFSKTVYGKMMFSDNSNKKFKKIILLKDVKIDNQTIFKHELLPNSFISYKNLYNFAKSLLIFNKKIYINIKEWDACEEIHRKSILEKLNSTVNNWFNINRNLQKKYENNLNIITSNNITNTILNTIKTNLTDIVFYCLITRGILSEYKTKISPKDKEECFNGYYFATQQKYNELDIIQQDEYTIPMTFKERILKKNIKLEYFALDWLEQIHFFKHFFNQRIMYVTGGTGTGKSTQIPKLLWYGLFLLGNYGGKVINTQPRVNATENNSKRISSEMGIPIEIYDNISKKMISSSNFYIQYQTEGKSHAPELNVEKYGVPPQSYLKIVTDGTLLQILLNNTYLKKTSNINLKKSELNQNVFDIVIVDEAHEHNANMDLILTLMRDTLQINNSLRLIIVTATIDDDEARYRRYYKYVNDNLLYPLNNTMFIYQQRVQFDRIAIDRRLHISKPLEDTKYNIDETYSTYPITTYDQGEKEAINKAIELTKTTLGDILLFSTSENAINNIVQILNNSNIPSNWIALPYYTKLADEWKMKITNISKSTQLSIDVNRKELFTAIRGNIYDKLTNTKTYTRVIIVATNVAEASITIDTLKVVIDTGYQVSVTYDPFLNISKTEIIPINESSRKQRKGRVGRIDNGSVYFMYQKGARELSKKKFPITENINELIYTLCKMIYNNNENKLLEYLPNTDENIYNQFNELPDSIKYQYYENYDRNIVSDNFYGNNILRNNKVNYYPNEYSVKYKSGYDLKTILDFDGTFYLVHPFESIYYKNKNKNKNKNKIEFTRDEWTGKITNFPSIIKDKFIQQFDELFKFRLITFNVDDTMLIKTYLYEIVNKLNMEINKIIGTTTIQDIWSYVLGVKYNLFKEVCWVNTIVNTSSIEDLSQKITLKNGKEKGDSALLMSNFGDTNSDLITYVNILKKLELILPPLEVLDSNVIMTEFNKYRNNNNNILTFEQIKIIKNIEKRDIDKLKLIKFYKYNELTDKQLIILEYFCITYGLDYKRIENILEVYYKTLIIENYIMNWNTIYDKYIPYFKNDRFIQFIYFSIYSNLKNIDDTNNTILIKDPNSIVKGEYIHSIKKEEDFFTKQIVMKHLSAFYLSVHAKAIIPAIIYPLKNERLIWKDKFDLYKNISSDKLEEYLLPEFDVYNNSNNINTILNYSNQLNDEQKKDRIEEINKINSNTKLYNTNLLLLFNLFYSNL